MDASTPALPRRLGLRSAVFVLVGSTIGSGIFRTPAVVAGRVPDVPLFLAAWIAGGLVAFAGAICMAELGAAIPRTGGVYAYLRTVYGRAAAFAFGWAELVVLRPAAYGAIAITTSEYLLRTAGISDDGAWFGVVRSQIVAALLLVAVGLVGRRGIDRAAWVQDVTTVFKLVALAALAGVAIVAGQSAASVVVGGGDVPRASALAGFGAALVAVFWSYDGWSDVGFVGGEIRRPERNLPLAFVLGTAVVLGVYLVVCAGYVRVLSLDQIARSPLVAADAARAVWGTGAERTVAALVALSTLGCLNGSMMTGPRIFYAMAEDGLLPERLARVHPRHETPAAAIDLSIVLGVVFVLLRTFAELADQFVLVIWPFYAACVVGVLVWRRRAPEARRPFRTPLAPVWAGIFLLAAVAMVGSYAVGSPGVVLANVALVACGMPIYLILQRRRSNP
ncbi:MAG: amino acid permease [Deltaproteobacteria bacterium]|nr:MAG: amino acid permease [Deltaproteobacteria bacterium]